MKEKWCKKVIYISMICIVALIICSCGQITDEGKTQDTSVSETDDINIREEADEQTVDSTITDEITENEADISKDHVEATTELVDDGKERNISFFAMDTYMNIKINGGSDGLLEYIKNDILGLEELWSVTKDHSEIALLNKNKEAELNEATEDIISKGLKMCEATDGALDLSVYPIVREWGFTTGDYKVPEQSAIDGLLKNVSYEKIEMDGNKIKIPEGSEIDLGSIAKGYIGDRIIETLKEYDVTSALLDLGGNIQALGDKTDGSEWKVGIQNPDGEGYFGVIKAKDKAVITSGGYERYFEDEAGNVWWHIIDPETGYPAKNGLISVTIISDKGLYCDALSTSLFVMGTDKAIDFWRANKDFDMILVTEDDGLIYTSGISDIFEIKDTGKFTNIAVLDPYYETDLS